MLTRAIFVRPRPPRLVQVPRLALDLETFVGRPVSEVEAAASCRELDRRGAFWCLRRRREGHTMLAKPLCCFSYGASPFVCVVEVLS